MLTTLYLLLAPVFADAPMLSPGCSREFQSVVLALEDALHAGDVNAARDAAHSLPTRQVRVRWDDSKIPVSRRAEFALQRDEALKSWTKGIPDVSFQLAEPADIQFRFSERLPARAGETLPAGAVHFLSTSAKEPRLDTVVALERGAPARPTEALDVFNEVGYAVGTYFGLARSPLMTGSFMGRTELPSMRALFASLEEYRIGRSNLEAAEQLRKAVLKGERMVPARPQVWVDQPILPTEPVLQGELIRFSLQVTNRGNAPLAVAIRPDCGCLTATQSAVLQPGDTSLLAAAIDTKEFVGVLNKRLIVFSNDPDFPVREIPLTVTVQPRFRLLSPAGSVLVAGNGPMTYDVFLVLNEGAQIQLDRVRLNGLPGKVTTEKWSGFLADPELGEPERERTGYRIHVALDGTLPPGRTAATLLLDTNNTMFPTLYHNFAAQKGIVALPDQVYLGEIAPAPRRVSFFISRPGPPFQIVKVSSNSATLKFEHVPQRDGWEHVVTVQFDGKAPFGNFEALITVETDDPMQPKVLVPIRGVIR